MSAQINYNERISTKKGGKRRFPTLGIVLIILFVIAIPIGIVLAMFPKTQDNSSNSNNNTVINSDNVNDVIDERNDKDENTNSGDYSSYETVMNLEWTFDNASAVSKDAYVANAENNPGTVYFTITTKGDNPEEIYRSPYIERGKDFSEIKLDKPLPVGTHECWCTYHLVNEDYEEQSQVNVNVTITIKN